MLLVLSAAAAQAQDQRAVLELVVNGVPAGESIVILRATAAASQGQAVDALVAVEVLRQAGLHGFRGHREAVGGRELVSLSSLAPDVTFSVDERDLRVTISASPELLGRQVRSFANGAPADISYRNDASAFVNYSASYGTGNRLDLFAESAVNRRGLLFYTSAATSGGTARRGLSNVVVDERRRMRRWTFGDNLGYSGALGGDAWLAGVTLSREFAIDPYFVKHPTLSLSTPISVPSVIEVHVNGQVVSQQPVAPGRLDVTHLPLTLGRNDARIVVRDAFGATRELSSTYYLTTSTLAPGVHDYQYSVGFRRDNVSTDSWRYGSPVATGRHRVGVTDTITLGGRAEVDPRRVFSAGPSMNLRTPVGEVEAAVSMSRNRAGWGSASQGSFTYAGRAISAGGSMMLASRGYATLSEYPAGEHPSVRASVFAGLALGGPWSLTLQHALDKVHDGASRSRGGLFSSVRLRRNLELSASLTRSRDARGASREAYGGVTLLFDRASAAVSILHEPGGTRLAVDAQQPLPAGVGYGYQMRAEGGASDTFSGSARYQDSHGRYELRQETLAGESRTTLNVAGALVAIGGGLHATRPVQDSFALIRVPGVEGVRGFASNQEVGKTGRGGDLLVPDLQAYYGNALNIADGDVPLQYSVPDIRLTLAPPYRGGAIALFDVRRVQRLVGRVNASYGELSLKTPAGAITSPIGGDGGFYFENIEPGAYDAVVNSGGRTCRLSLAVPVSDSAVIKLGARECEWEAAP